MENLITALLDMAQLEKGESLEFADCNLGLIALSAADLVESLAEQREITLDIRVDEDLGMVSGDRRMLGQVMNNLLTNAIKYNREGGAISVSVTNQPDFVRVDISDNGVGIPESDQPFVFDQFFRAGNSAQTRASGSGLGLAIVKTIIQRHRGYIWVKSVEGQGSVFSFTIPRKNQLSEGTDVMAVGASTSSEGNDTRHSSYDEASIEEVDVIDDNTQESRGSKEIDSSSDVV